MGLDLDALLVAVAENPIGDALLVLGDFLEEAGDFRADAMENLRVGQFEYTRRWSTWIGFPGCPHRIRERRDFDTELEARLDLTHRVLALFPDGPRWRVEYAGPGRPVRVAAGPFLSPAQAGAKLSALASRPAAGRGIRVAGPFWPKR
jgi:hypothetical protein